MGVVLPKPILSKVVERIGSPVIKGAVCSMNGARNSMEDAHVMCINENSMLFGVFDGHSNDKCSAFIAKHLPGRVAGLPLPISDATWTQLCLELDQQFMEEEGNDGGTTATFAFLQPAGPDKMSATVLNIGDSRTLHVKKNGAISFATVDHKPLVPEERQRIERAGGSVRMNRVDGDLAVSRAFGDGSFKRSNKENPREQKVVAVPEISHIEIERGDLLLLCCDGVFEGSFPNDEVASFVATNIEQNTHGDVGVAAAKVCDQAVRRGSKDNITCMIIHFADGTDFVHKHGETSFLPGPPYSRTHEPSRTAYTKIAAMANVSLVDALVYRYQLLEAHLSKAMPSRTPLEQIAFDMSDDVEIEVEKTFFGTGPTSPANLKSYIEQLIAPPSNW